MSYKNNVAKHNSKRKRDSQKNFVHKEVNSSEMKRCRINDKTFIFIPANADEEEERKKYIESQQHYRSIYDPAGGRSKKM